MTEEFIFAQKYRPKKISECILPERIKSYFQSCIDNKEIPNLMLTGTAGVGKTTAALALCEEIGVNYLFINSSKERGVDTLRTKIQNYASTMSLKGGKKVIILDESDYMTQDAQAGLRGSIEEFSKNCTFILTCNFKSRLMDALHSRSVVIDFTLRPEEKPKMAMAFMKRIEQILKAENIEYEKEAIVQIVKKFFPDYRRTLNELQKYSNTGKIDSGIFSALSDIRNLSDLVGFLKDKNFSAMRKWVVSNSDIDASNIYRNIYDSLYTYLKPDSIPQAVVILAKYQYQSAFVADQEINLVACLTEMMVELQYV